MLSTENIVLYRIDVCLRSCFRPISSDKGRSDFVVKSPEKCYIYIREEVTKVVAHLSNPAKVLEDTARCIHDIGVAKETKGAVEKSVNEKTTKDTILTRSTGGPGPDEVIISSSYSERSFWSIAVKQEGVFSDFLPRVTLVRSTFAGTKGTWSNMQSSLYGHSSFVVPAIHAVWNHIDPNQSSLFTMAPILRSRG